MKKRPIIICLVVAILGALLFWLESNCIISGWLKGEAFYQGRPTGYWRRELGNVSVIKYGGNHGILFRVSSPLTQRIDPTIDDKLEFIKDHPLWNGGREAKGVLSELMLDSSPHIRAFAEECLARIKE